MPETKYLTKVIKLEILKPTVWVGGAKNGQPCSWKELAETLRTIQYLSARVANQFISDRYVESQIKRLPGAPEYRARKLSEINTALRAALIAEGKFTGEQLSRFSTKGCLLSVVIDALRAGIIDPQISGANWREVMAANSAVPSYKRRIPVCIRCDKAEHRKIVEVGGEHLLELGATVGGKIQMVLRTGRLDGSARHTLEQLCKPGSGYTQQSFQIAFNERRKKWFLSCVFRFPPRVRALDPTVVVGADLGYSCPLVAAVSSSDHAMIGRREFAPLSEQVKRLQGQTIRRRRLAQGAGRDSFVADTARGGHGRKRRLRPIERLEGKIHNAYKTLNHQISRRLVDFALQHGAGTIQIEDLEGLQEQLTGTFLGERWRYHELQQMVAYKAKEQGIEVRKVEARYTSRRCHKCGHINEGFTREYRDRHKPAGGGVALFNCPECDLVDFDPDYNAAKNLCDPEIGKRIRSQCRKQGITRGVEGDD